jgi:hypothetical protein
MLDKLLNKEDVLKQVQFKGPLIPAYLVGVLKSNTIMIGAALSELASDNRVRISHMKVGGSPLYYADEQRAKLQDFYKYLNEKDRRTFDELKQKKILRDNEITPLLRVSLRNIKDFAVPIEIEYKGKKELFWRWYLLDKQEAVNLIKSFLAPLAQQMPSVKEQVLPKQKETEEKQNAASLEVLSTKLQSTAQSQITNAIIGQESAQKKERAEKTTEKIYQKPAVQRKPITQAAEQFIKPTTEQTSLLSVQTLLETSDDSLVQRSKAFFFQKSIIVKEMAIIKKEKEIMSVIKVPSSIGEVEYYCSIRSKKKITDIDLAAVYLEAQNRKLLAAVLTAGEFTKKAYEKVQQSFFNMKLLQI